MFKISSRRGIPICCIHKTFVCKLVVFFLQMHFLQFTKETVSAKITSSWDMFGSFSFSPMMQFQKINSYNRKKIIKPNWANYTLEDILLYVLKLFMPCFRSHHAFVDDCLDGYIVAACMELMNIESPNDAPVTWKPSPLLVHQSKELQYEWLKKLGNEILNQFIKIDKGI